MLPAVIRVAFDPELELGPFLVRWQALGLAATSAVALLWWANRLSERVPGVRRDDILYVVLGVIPGAVVFGRLLHGLSYPDAYLAQPGTLFDLDVGSLSLLGAVLGGVISGAYLCRLLHQRVATWADSAALPLLFAIGFGKLALFLGGGGQGLPQEGATAVAFGGPGPWLSAGADLPSHPTAVYEGLLTLLGLIVLAWLARKRRWAGDGRLFVTCVAWWLGARVLVGFTWRDEQILGPMGTEQLAALLALSALLVPLPGRRRDDEAAAV